MAVREILLPWDSQPQEAVSAFGDGPLANGLALLWVASASFDVIGGRQPDTNNTTQTASVVGAARQCAVGQANVEWNREAILTSDGAGTGDFTIAVLAKADAYNTAMEHLFAQKNDAGGAPYSQASLLIHGNGATGAATSGMVSFLTYSTLNTNANLAAAVRVGEWALYGGRRSGSTVTVLADRSSASASGTIRDIANGTRRTAIGSRGNGTTESFRGAVAFAAAWNRALTDAEWAQLVANPWQLLEPQRIIIPRAAAGGSTYPVSLTANGTIAASATRSVLRLVSATSASSASMTRVRALLRAASATATASASASKHVSLARAATATGTASLSKVMAIARTITASATITASRVRVVGLIRSASATATAFRTRIAGLTRSATATSSASLTAVKAILRTVSATATASAALARDLRRLVTVTVTVVAIRSRVISMARTASSTATAARSRIVSRTRSASATGSAALDTVKLTARLLSATAAGTATLAKLLQKRLTATKSIQAVLTIVSSAAQQGQIAVDRLRIRIMPALRAIRRFRDG